MNRKKSFIEQIKKIIIEDNGKNYFYLASMDIAEFKQINYHYGFEAGNHLLDDLEDFINAIPHCVLCDRPGSDRYLFLTKHPEQRKEDDMIASFDFWWNKFWRNQHKKFPICNLKAWCGLYHISEGKEVQFDDIQSAIENADLARHKARELNRNSAVYCEHSLMQEATNRKLLEYRILEALEANCFTYWLQPQVDIRTGKISGAEALARGTFETGEVISPAIFIPVLEKNGKILRLDLMILQQVCRDLRKRLDCGEPVIPISINLSRIDMRNENLVELIDSIVSKYDIPHKYLKFEVTESIVMDSFIHAQHIIEKMGLLGYKISIDDFGSGFAGIDVCRKLDFDELKIDKSLVDEIEDKNETCKIIIEAISAIMNRLGIDVVCEGVETARQCQEILSVGGRIVQGYYFSKPVPSIEFYQKLDTTRGQYSINF